MQNYNITYVVRHLYSEDEIEKMKFACKQLELSYAEYNNAIDCIIGLAAKDFPDFLVLADIDITK